MQTVNHIVLEIRTSDEIRLEEAQKMRFLGMNESGESGDLVLSFLDTHTELRRPGAKVGNGYIVNFSNVDRRRWAGNLSKKQPLPKAIGLSNCTVVDATAGFCGDALLLALMGFHVTAIERSPIVSVLLRDGIRRAEQDVELWVELDNRLQIIEGDSVRWLQQHKSFDAVYIEPMFPKKKKPSPLPPGHIQLLAQLVGGEGDAQELFRVARDTNANRVVVKRPNHAPPMQDNPINVHKGKQIRYEVYATSKSTKTSP